MTVTVTVIVTVIVTMIVTVTVTMNMTMTRCKDLYEEQMVEVGHWTGQELLPRGKPATLTAPVIAGQSGH